MEPWTQYPYIFHKWVRSKNIIAISEKTQTHAFMVFLKIFSIYISKIKLIILKDFEENGHKRKCFKLSKSLVFLMQMEG